MPNPNPTRGPRRVAPVEELPRGFSRRPDGRLRYRFTPSRGARPVDVYGWSIEECLRKRYAPPVVVELEPSSVTVEAFLESWLEGLALRANTIAGHRFNVEHHLVPALPRRGMTLAELDRTAVRVMLETIRSKRSRNGGTLAPRTVSIAYATLRRALYYGVEEGLIASNPAARINPNGTTGRGARERLVGVELRIPSDLEVRRVVTAAQGEAWAPLLRLSILTGLRQSELLGLASSSWDDSHLEVSRQLPRGTTTPDDPKNQSSARTLPIGATALATLRELKLARSVAQVKAGSRWRNADDFLATDERGAPLNGSTLSHWLTAMCERAGVEPFRWHDLRHVYATGLLNRGVPIALVSKYLGHASPTITSRVYHHVYRTPDELGVGTTAERVLAG